MFYDKDRPAGSLSDIDRSTAANDPRSS